LRSFLTLFTALVLTACTTQGKLEYISTDGSIKVACETEYSGAPAVDYYAVEYVLSHCAQKAAKKGLQVVDQSLLETDLSIPENPDGEPWTFERATELYKANRLTDKEYGYLVAFIDLNLRLQNE